MRLVLSYPPYANRTYQRYVGGVRLIDAVSDYRAKAGWEARAQHAEVLEGPLRVRMDLYRPRKRGDIDGPIKQCLDSMNGIAWVDDSQVVELHVRRFDDKKQPRVEVTIEAIDG